MHVIIATDGCGAASFALIKIMLRLKAGTPFSGGAIAGVWKLKSYARRLLDTGEVRNDMLPNAYIMYTPGGHMMSITVEENRQPPAGPVLTDEERIG